MSDWDVLVLTEDAVQLISAYGAFQVEQGSELEMAAYSFVLHGRFLDLFGGWLDDLRDKLPPKDVVLAVASAAYDRVVVFVDIPGVPELAEQYLEKMLKPIAMAWVEAAYDRLAAE